MNVNQAHVKMVEHVLTEKTATTATVPMDIQERVVKLVSTFSLLIFFIRGAKFLNQLNINLF